MGWVEPNSEELIPLKADINRAIILKKKEEVYMLFEQML